MLGAGGGVLAGADAGDGVELVDQVRLIEVAVIGGEAGPVDGGTGGEVSDHGLEAPHAAVLLGRHAHLLLEKLDETACAEAGGFDDFGDGARAGAELPERIIDGAMALERFGEAGKERGFQDVEARAGGFGRERAFTDFAREAAPDAAERDLEAVKLVGGQAEKREGAAGAEVHAENAGLLVGIDDEVLRARAGEDAAFEALEAAEIAAVVGANFVFAQVDDQLHGAIGEEALEIVRTAGAFPIPEDFDETGKPRRGPAVSELHGLRISRAACSAGGIREGIQSGEETRVMRSTWRFGGAALVFVTARLMIAQPFELVINNGRVMDPASNLDAVRNIGIRGGKIAEISQIPLTARRVIDAAGLVVAPGFIDLHSHGQTAENYRYKARDGVTTALEMEVGVNPVAAWYRERQGRALINFGATSGDIPARIAVMHDSGVLLPRDKATARAATAEEFQQVLERITKGLDEGALGIGMGIAYLPHESRAEVYNIFELAAKRHVPIYVHMRNGGPVEPGVVDALQEVLADATATGASLHVVHITSVGLRQTQLCLAMIDGAHGRGLDVTTEAYPYTAGMTDIASAIFNDGWQQRQGGIGFGDLQWALTGERLTPESFARFRKQGGMVAVHSIPEEITRLAIAHPNVMVASDGILDEGKGHPRAAGTYARVLGRYAREQHALSLMEALKKMTLLPAQRLGAASKGRIAIGADADVTVFDAAKVIDRATFEKPAQYSEGIQYVLVNGTPVVDRGELVANVSPGRAVRR